MPDDALLILSSAADPFCTSSFMQSPVLIGGGAEAEATIVKGISVERADCMLCSLIVRSRVCRRLRSLQENEKAAGSSPGQGAKQAAGARVRQGKGSV